MRLGCVCLLTNDVVKLSNFIRRCLKQTTAATMMSIKPLLRRKPC